MADDIAITEIDDPGLAARVEAVGWGLVCRVGIRVVRLDRLVGWLDRVPRRRPNTGGVVIPTTRHFRGGGACLSRSLARSQYLRVRGAPSTVVVGIAGSVAELDAHAWLEPLDPPEHHAPAHHIAR